MVEEEHVWPWQLTIVWTAMLPKDQQGDQERPICLLAQLVRLWNVVRKPVGAVLVCRIAGPLGQGHQGLFCPESCLGQGCQS